MKSLSNALNTIESFYFNYFENKEVEKKDPLKDFYLCVSDAENQIKNKKSIEDLMVSAKKIHEKFKDLKISHVKYTGNQFKEGSYLSNHVSHYLTTEGKAIRTFDEILKKIIGTIANQYKGQYESLSLRTENTEGSFEKEFLTRVANAAWKNILTQKNNKGFIYQIKNKNGVTHHLVGTIHLASEVMAYDKRFTKIIEESSELYSELGLDYPILGINILNQLLSYSRVRYSMDTLATYKAKAKKLNIYGLDLEYRETAFQNGQFIKVLAEPKEQKKSNLNDSENESENIDLKKSIEIKSNETIEEIKRETSNESNLNSDKSVQEIKKTLEEQIRENPYPAKISITDFLSMENLSEYRSMLEAYQEGNEKFFEKNLDLYNNIKLHTHLRTTLWLNGDKFLDGLLEKLLNADKSICIFVGACHCAGDIGLVKAFKDVGLEVIRK